MTVLEYRNTLEDLSNRALASSERFSPTKKDKPKIYRQLSSLADRVQYDVNQGGAESYELKKLHDQIQQVQSIFQKELMNTKEVSEAHQLIGIERIIIDVHEWLRDGKVNSTNYKGVIQTLESQLAKLQNMEGIGSFQQEVKSLIRLIQQQFKESDIDSLATEKGKKIGEGKFSTVYDYGTFVYKELKEPKERFKVQNELLTVGLHHPNITRVLGVKTNADNQVVGMEMEKVNGMELKDVLLSEKKLSNDEKLSLVTELLDAARYLELQHVLQDDYNSSNLMIDENAHLKLIDFGLAKRVIILPKEEVENNSVYEKVSRRREEPRYQHKGGSSAVEVYTEESRESLMTLHATRVARMICLIMLQGVGSEYEIIKRVSDFKDGKITEEQLFENSELNLDMKAILVTVIKGTMIAKKKMTVEDLLHMKVFFRFKKTETLSLLEERLQEADLSDQETASGRSSPDSRSPSPSRFSPRSFLSRIRNRPST